MEDKDEQKYILYNWSPEKKESPYSYGSEYPKYEYVPFKFRILEDKDTADLHKNRLLEEKKLGEMAMLAELWDLHLVDNIRVSNLINPVYLIKDELQVDNFMEIIDLSSSLLDESKPVKVYASYPFWVWVEQVIEPIKLVTYGRQIETHRIMPFGYIAWQVGKYVSKLNVSTLMGSFRATLR
ncbi:MAG: hypothetical protein R2824_26580 [Saprospiraceae bacterium]